MSTTNAPNRRRRQFALGALTVLLHVCVFDWFSGQLGRAPGRHADRAHPDGPVVTELLPVPDPAPVPIPPPAPPEPVPEPPPPLPDVQAELPPLPEDGDGPAIAVTGGAPTPDAAADGTPSGQEGAVAATPGVQSSQAAPAVAPAATATPPAPPPPPVPEARRYRVDMPPPADITLDVARTDADGTKWSGEALLSWRIAPTGYRVRVEAGIRVVFTRVNLLTLTSEGTVGDEGFVPILMTEKRRGRAQTATHFNRKDGTLTYSASQAKYPLTPYAQDKASLPLQLSAIARGDPKQLSGAIDLLVGEDRDANVFSFTVAGQEEIDTKLGRIATWHLVRPPKPGSYHSRLELWLAPGYGWYPVQIRNTEASGAVTTQTVSNIDNKNKEN